MTRYATMLWCRLIDNGCCLFTSYSLRCNYLVLFSFKRWNFPVGLFVSWRWFKTEFDTLTPSQVICLWVDVCIPRKAKERWRYFLKSKIDVDGNAVSTTDRFNYSHSEFLLRRKKLVSRMKKSAFSLSNNENDFRSSGKKQRQMKKYFFFRSEKELKMATQANERILMMLNFTVYLTFRRPFFVRSPEKHFHFKSIFFGEFSSEFLFIEGVETRRQLASKLN